MKLSIDIIKNSIFLFVAKVVNSATTFAIGLYLAKSMGVETFGQYTFILNYFFLFSIIFSLGLGTFIIRETAKNPDQVAVYFSNISFIGFVSSAVGLIIMFSMVKFFNLTKEGQYALNILNLAIFPTILILTWESLLITFQKNRYILTIQGVEGMVKMVLCYFVISRGYGIIYLMTVIVLTRFLSGIFYYLVLNKVFYPLSFKISFTFIRETLQQIPTFAALYCFAILFSSVDLMMLALLTNFNDVGIYSAASKLIGIICGFASCVATVLLPILSRYSKESPERFMRISFLSVFYSTVFLLPIVILSIYFSDNIIIMIYSKDFSNAILPFQILIATICFYMIDLIFAHCLVACRYQNLNLKAVMTATCINIILNLILIPKYSYVGASISTFVSMVILTLVHHYFVRKKLYQIVFFKMLLAILLAASPFVVLYLNHNLSLIILLPIASLIYVSLIFVIKSFILKYWQVSLSQDNIIKSY